MKDLHNYITPYDSSVKSFYKKYARGKDTMLAKSLYLAVRDNIEYRDDLSLDTWSMPKEVIARGWGDCEDSAALLTSLYILGGFEAKMTVFYPMGWEISHVAVLIKDHPKTGWNRVDPTRANWNFGDTTSYAPITVDLFEVDVNGTYPMPESIFSPLVNLQAMAVMQGLLPNSRSLDIPAIKDMNQ